MQDLYTYKANAADRPSGNVAGKTGGTETGAETGPDIGPDIGLWRVLAEAGASDAGVCALEPEWLDARERQATAGLPWAIAIVVRLSETVTGEIGPAGPTWTYFHHYRTVNTLLDQIALRTGLWLQEQGARCLAVAASQSDPEEPFRGRWSHKRTALMAGLGGLGRSALFLHRSWGPRVRLGTLFTDWQGCAGLAHRHGQPDRPGSLASPGLSPWCASCRRCIDACPAGALSCPPPDATEACAIDRAACSSWMKKQYQHIGRGAVCGICMEVCPAGRQTSPDRRL